MPELPPLLWLMLVVSYSVYGPNAMLNIGLNAMFNICSEYSKLWCYCYNAEKCAIIVFNERNNNGPNRNFFLGNIRICEWSKYTHLCVV